MDECPDHATDSHGRGSRDGHAGALEGNGRAAEHDEREHRGAEGRPAERNSESPSAEVASVTVAAVSGWSCP
jgi:hypothetical protein